MTVIEKLEVELGILEKDAINILEDAEKQLDETKKAQQEFAEVSSSSLGMYTTAVVGAFSGLMFWLSKTSPVVQMSMANMGFAFETIGMIIGDRLAPAFESAEGAVWILADAIDDTFEMWDKISLAASDAGDSLRDFATDSTDKLTELGTSISDIVKSLLGLPETTETEIKIKYVTEADEAMTKVLKDLPEDASAPDVARALIEAPVEGFQAGIKKVGEDVAKWVREKIQPEQQTTTTKPPVTTTTTTTTTTTSGGASGSWGSNTSNLQRDFQNETDGNIKYNYSEIYKIGKIISGGYNKLVEWLQ